VLGGLTASAAVSGCAREKNVKNETEPTESDLLSTPSELGAPRFHRHLVLPGKKTTYLLRIFNYGEGRCSASISIEESTEGWNAELEKEEIKDILKGEYKEVKLTVKAGNGLSKGEVARIKIAAKTDNGLTDSAEVAAEITDKAKIIFVSIDSLHPDYLKLNSRGTGPGKPGDWLMPNLLRLLDKGTFYPEHKVHVITATDMNHFNFLAGTNTGTSGISLVGGSIFGFDEDNNVIFKAAPLDLNFYGSDGKRVRILFNAAKDYNKNSLNIFVAGKNWVPNMMLAPEQQLDLIINGEDVPEYIEKSELKTPEGYEVLKRIISTVVFGIKPSKGYSLGNPAQDHSKQDSRQDSMLARLIEAFPNHFPSDRWVMDAALKAIENEDPDVLYILLAAVDDAGHAFGSAFDLEEWDDQGSDDVRDHVSRYDSRASRQGILNVVREADRQVGKLIEELEERNTFDSTVLIVESDHSMITYYREALDMGRQLVKNSNFSPKNDYFFGSAASIGVVYLRKNNPQIIKDIEKALEVWKVKNPVSGEPECPVSVFNRNEMITGKDNDKNGPEMLPKEFYSEYYIKHRKPGEQLWPDLLILTKPHYKFKVQNFGLRNLGLPKLPFPLPEKGYFIGGHGSFATRPGLLIMSGPDIPAGQERKEIVYTSDVAPTIYRLMGWTVPECVDGKALPGILKDKNIKS